ncbi:MAG TPA: hypothetical protein VJ725_00385 [Thermoanaerobaculia bacterium]|nr:hypothetical protein [Thermoanaerobaculia bacterium]
MAAFFPLDVFLAAGFFAALVPPEEALAEAFFAAGFFALFLRATAMPAAAAATPAATAEAMATFFPVPVFFAALFFAAVEVVEAVDGVADAPVPDVLLLEPFFVAAMEKLLS